LGFACALPGAPAQQGEASAEHRSKERQQRFLQNLAQIAATILKN
jgi:hypothetical protein